MNLKTKPPAGNPQIWVQSCSIIHRQQVEGLRGIHWAVLCGTVIMWWTPNKWPLPNADRSSFMAAIAELKDMFAGLSQQVNTKLDSVIGELNIKQELTTTLKICNRIRNQHNFCNRQKNDTCKQCHSKAPRKTWERKRGAGNKTNFLEIHDRKQNLLVYGVPDNKN